MLGTTLKKLERQAQSYTTEEEQGLKTVTISQDRKQKEINLLSRRAGVPTKEVTGMLTEQGCSSLQEYHIAIKSGVKCSEPVVKQTNVATLHYPYVDGKIEEIISPETKSKSSYVWHVYPGMDTASLKDHASAVKVMLQGANKDVEEDIGNLQQTSLILTKKDIAARKIQRYFREKFHTKPERTSHAS